MFLGPPGNSWGPPRGPPPSGGGGWGGPPNNHQPPPQQGKAKRITKPYLCFGEMMSYSIKDFNRLP